MELLNGDIHLITTKKKPIMEEVAKGTSGIYLIQCNVNGKNYIGSSRDIRARWTEHLNCLREKRHHSMKLQEDWNNFGESSFEFHVLEKVPYAASKKIEQEYIEKFKSDKFGYNTGSFKENREKRANMRCQQILEYINDSYEPDGNTYCYDFFKMADFLKMVPSDLLKFLGINIDKKFNVYMLLDDKNVIGINWDTSDIFVEVTNRLLFNEKSERIWVD